MSPSRKRQCLVSGEVGGGGKENKTKQKPHMICAIIRIKVDPKTVLDLPIASQKIHHIDC